MILYWFECLVVIAFRQVKPVEDEVTGGRGRNTFVKFVFRVEHLWHVADGFIKYMHPTWGC